MNGCEGNLPELCGGWEGQEIKAWEYCLACPHRWLHPLPPRPEKPGERLPEKLLEIFSKIDLLDMDYKSEDLLSIVKWLSDLLLDLEYIWIWKDSLMCPE